MFTVGSNIFFCERAVAEFVAEYYNLRWQFGKWQTFMGLFEWAKGKGIIFPDEPGNEATDAEYEARDAEFTRIFKSCQDAYDLDRADFEAKLKHPRFSADFEEWEDSQTGGGGCRIVWNKGVVWVSCHSGYAHADITDIVAQEFRDYGCKEQPQAVWALNPMIYPEWMNRDREIEGWQYPMREGD